MATVSTRAAVVRWHQLVAGEIEAEATFWLPYVLVADVRATLRRARRLGGTLVAGPLELAGIGRWAVLVDSGGAVFGIRASSD